MTSTSIDRRRLLGRIAGLLLAIPLAASAEYPDRPITIVVPFAPGGSTDVIVRMMQEPLQRYLKQPVIINNRVGGAGVIGTIYVAHAPADGYTLLMPSNSFVIAPHTKRDIGYSPFKDFAPISTVAVQPLLLTVHPSVPAKNVRELIDHAKANPGKLEYGSNGQGGFTHLVSELFNRTAGTQMVHVPYKGQAPNAQALLTGEVKMNLTVTSAQMNEFIKAGRVRLLGVSSSKPTPLAEGVPLIADTLPNFSAEIWYGLFAPASTPAPVIARLNEAVAFALGQPDIRQKVIALGASPTTSTPAELSALISGDDTTWGRIIREANINFD